MALISSGEVHMPRFICVLLLILACHPASVSAQSAEAPYVLLVSFDGFRHDYAARASLDNFHWLEKQGVSSEGIVPAFPSNTFPNHYTLVTGLYPGHHGLVDNSFYVPGLDRHYRLGDRNAVRDAVFYGGVPLWQYVQRFGMKSASFFWVGSEAPVEGRHPDYFHYYDGSVPDRERIESVFEWFALPEEERPQLVTLYFSFVDSIGHDHGPDSAALNESLPEADALLGEIIAGIRAAEVPINLIVTSDHGMYPVTTTRDSVITVESDLPAGFMAVTSQTLIQLYARTDADIDEAYAHLKAKEKNFRVFRKGETPRHWHYGIHDHIGDLLLVADPGHVFAESQEAATGQTIGVHGYDPYTVDEMQGIFYAWGPDIRQGMHIGSFENIHLFPFVTRLLNLPDSQNIDGEAKVLLPLLKAQSPAESSGNR